MLTPRQVNIPYGPIGVGPSGWRVSIREQLGTTRSHSFPNMRYAQFSPLGLSQGTFDYFVQQGCTKLSPTELVIPPGHVACVTKYRITPQNKWVELTFYKKYDPILGGAGYGTHRFKLSIEDFNKLEMVDYTP